MISRTGLAMDNEHPRKPTRIIEVVGPAGAGKTTLCALLRSSTDIRLSNFPDVRDPADAPFFLWHGLRVALDLLRGYPKALSELSRREFAWLSILKGWPHELQRALIRHNDLILLDQGPVFLLSEMSLFGPRFLRGERTKEIWRAWYGQWAPVLDLVVWLDAPDECLWQRILSREKEHLVKAESPQAVFQFLKDYRAGYERVFSQLKANGARFRMLKFDTSRQTPEAIAHQLLSERRP